jgi:glycosyltransferase involved in cell wall biosynthesis
MKILLLTTLYPEETRPDLRQDTKAIHYFARQWVKDGHEVLVIHIYLHPLRDLFHRKKKFGISLSINEGVKVVLLEKQLMIPHARRLLRFQQKATSTIINRFLSKEFFSPDVLIAHFPTFLTGVVDRIDIKCPRIAVLHYADAKTLKKINDRKKIKEMFSKYNGIGFRGKHIQKVYQKYESGHKNFFMVYSGVPPNFITQENYKYKTIQDKSQEFLKIVYVGNLIPLKNVDITIKALHKVAKDVDFKFTIIGDGPELKNLKMLVSKLGLEERVTFTGKLTRDQALSIMRESDLFIMVSSPETFGLVYLEAMSQGCIVIGSKGEGIDGIIKDGYNGFLVSPHNQEELAQKIYLISNMEEERKKTVLKNAYNTVSRMTDKDMAEKYIERITEIVNMYSGE